MKYIFWLITSFLTIFLNYIILAYAHYDIASLSAWFILPIGAACLGALASSGYMFGSRIFHRKSTKNKTTKLILSSLIVIFGFVGIHYLVYLSTYIDSNEGMNYTFRGSHISEFVLNDGDETTNFINYMKFTIANSSSTLNLKGQSEGIDLGSHSTLNWISFWISFVGYICGSLTVILESNEKYTETNIN